MKSSKFAITISRQYGSGGLLISKKLAKELKVSSYDKELIEIASKKSGVAGDFFSESKNKKGLWLLGNLTGFATNLLGFDNTDNNLDESVFEIQSKIIKALARKDSAVFVGRSADYVLRMHSNMISVFITADMEDRVERIRKALGVSKEKALKEIEKKDKSRAAYYEHYTGKVWGHAASYDLCVNSSVLGINSTAKLVKSFVKEKLKI